jgi:hypothetical protein
MEARYRLCRLILETKVLILEPWRLTLGRRDSSGARLVNPEAAEGSS